MGKAIGQAGNGRYIHRGVRLGSGAVFGADLRVLGKR